MHHTGKKFQTRSRTLRWVAVAVSTAIALAGCATNGGAPAGKTVLTVQIATGDGIAKMNQAFAAGFEKKNPNVTIKFVHSPDDNVNVPVLTGNNAPDVGMAPLNEDTTKAMADNGDLVNLGPAWKAADLDTRYPAGVSDSALYGGKHYAISTNVLYYSFAYYNKDLFEKAGITIPANHRIASSKDLYDISAKLNKIGKQGLAVGGGTGYQPSWLIDALLPTAATPQQMTNYLSNWQKGVKPTVSYTDGPFVKTLQQLKDYADNGVFQKGFAGITDLAAVEASFVSQQSGMLLDGVWYAGTLAITPPGFAYDWVLLPPVDGAKQKSQLPTLFNFSVVIPTKGKHKAVAMQYVAYITSVEAQTRGVIDAGQSIPSVTDLPASAFKSLSPAVKGMLADVAKNGSQPGWTSTVPTTYGQTFSTPVVQAVWSGSDTPRSAGAKVQAEYKSVTGN